MLQGISPHDFTAHEQYQVVYAAAEGMLLDATLGV
jgi:hypothetical protein